VNRLLLLLLLAQIPNPQAQNGAVTGVLRTSAGKPASGVRITAMVPPESSTNFANATAMAGVTETDADGQFRLENIPPGRYYITAGRLDFPTYYPGATDLAGGKLILVASGEIVAAVNFALKDESARTSAYSGNATYSIPVSIQVDEGGKIPVFQQGTYPVLRFIQVRSNKAVEIGFAETRVLVPVPISADGDEYRVTVADLRDGYTVKSIAYGAADIQKENLKVPRPSPGTMPNSIVGLPVGMLSAIPPATYTSATTLTIVLSKLPLVQTTRRVHGSGSIVGDEIYISNTPGIIYSDGTFEFRDVPPGLHSIVKFKGNAVVGVAPVQVRNRDVDGVVLQPATILPADIFADPPKPLDGTAGMAGDSKTFPLLSIVGRVLDEVSQEPAREGAVTIAGYGTTRRTIAIISDGYFEIPNLLPGSYSVTINIFGYVTETHSIIVGTEDLKLDWIGHREPR
jgi:hypothetical protein